MCNREDAEAHAICDGHRLAFAFSFIGLAGAQRRNKAMLVLHINMQYCMHIANCCCSKVAVFGKHTHTAKWMVVVEGGLANGREAI